MSSACETCSGSGVVLYTDGHDQEREDDCPEGCERPDRGPPCTLCGQRSPTRAKNARVPMCRKHAAECMGALKTHPGQSIEQWIEAKAVALVTQVLEVVHV